MKDNQITHKEMSSLGGRASAERLTPSQRSERAKKAGKKGGWPKGKPRVPKVTKGMSVLNIVALMNKGYSQAQIEKALEKLDQKTAQEDGKYFGECECCGYKTVLVQETDMCGPCTFGEAETVNGNW